MTEEEAIAAGWIKLRRGWYHPNAWQYIGWLTEPKCYRTLMNLTLELEEKLRFTLDTIAEHRKDLSDWERGFFDDQVKRFEEYGSKVHMSPKQWAVLNRMYDKVTEVLDER